MIIVIFDFNACSVTASIVFCVSAFAALLRALFFAFQCLQRYCEHCFLRFIACSVTASTVFCVLSLAALLRALFFPFQRLQRYCEHCFLLFIVCSVTASTVFRISALAALLRALKFLFSSLQNGGTCWNGRGGACVPARTSAQRRFHPKMMCCHLQTRCFHPRKASLTMDAPSRGELAGKQVRPLPHLTTTSATFLQNHSSFRNERKAEHRSYHLPC